MDPVRNPFAPGAGTRPPELAGRDELLERAAVALDRIALGRPARSFILYGLRGTGKTVLLGEIRRDAEARGLQAMRVEAPEGRSLPAMLAAPLRALLLKLDRMESTKQGAQKALRALASFAKLKVAYHDIEVTIDAEPEKGVADSGDLEVDLTELLLALGEAAKERGTAAILAIDEIQYVKEAEMAALISALHAVAQAQLPVAMVAAGLPQLLGQMGRAKSYAERLFEYVEVAALVPGEARNAILIPIEREEESIEPAAVEAIVAATEGYPYFLQEWGKHAWDLAFASPISLQDVENASITALAELDASFFRVRFDRLTPSEKRYMRAMAELGPGPHRSGDIAEMLGKLVTQLAPTRNSLIRKGMLYSPAHGDTAFTVPMFDQFMKRIMPELG
ncbi:ATP-binding protein [Sandaracinobacter neustonicus]|uniref:ATP-binding protein n=1 Tax=Sandaracinobacter neustonicus TaxID=1715348 RepID=A0A501XGZ0_9SPHN|nr:ATP-binding protein [Sandaracinobacter neustonicus]TPE59564.1 ATP-binding protein [Sandaracinobacter neustonicus]